MHQPHHQIWCCRCFSKIFTYNISWFCWSKWAAISPLMRIYLGPRSTSPSEIQWWHLEYTYLGGHSHRKRINVTGRGNLHWHRMRQLLKVPIFVLMIHLLSKIIKTLYENFFYAEKVIRMWAQVWESQEPLRIKSLLSNHCILFGLSEGSTQETPSYLV